MAIWLLYRSNKIIKESLSEVPKHPVDVVYTWANGNDKKWLAVREKYAKLLEKKFPCIHDASRFTDHGELKYSIRSILKFLQDIPVRKIFIVTDCAPPEWLKNYAPLKAPSIQLVDPSDLFPQELKDFLPVYNSNAIECWINHIPGLSEHFIYLNDDMMFGANVYFSDLFDAKGRPIRYSMQFLPKTFIEPHDGPMTIMNVRTRSLIRYLMGGHEPLEPSHFAYTMNKSTFDECQRAFYPFFCATASNRFRGDQDTRIINLVLMYDALTQRSAIKIADGGFVSVTDNEYITERMMKDALGHKFICINDDTVSRDPKKYEKVIEILEDLLPEKSPYEEAPINVS